MSAMMSHPVPHAKYRRAEGVVEREAALELSVQPPTAHQLISGGQNLAKRAALVARVMVRCGQRRRALRWLLPILAELRRGTTPLTPGLIRLCQHDDLAEDVIEADYQANPSDPAAERWVSKIDAEIAALLELRAALVEKHQLERN